MTKKIFLICCFLISVRLMAQTEMKSTPGFVTIENKQVSLTFDIEKGVYSVKNIPKNITAISNAYFQAEGLYSTDTTGIIEWSYKEINDIFGKGGSLRIRKKYDGYSDMVMDSHIIR